MAFPTQIASYTDATDIGYFSEEPLSGYIFDTCFKHLAADSTGFGIEEMCWQALPENEDTYEPPPGFSQPLAREKLPGLNFAGISTASPVASTAEQSPVSLIKSCSESRFANGSQANSNGDLPNAALENSSTTKFGHQTIGENLPIDGLSSDTVEGKYIFIDSEDEMEAKYIIIDSEDENDITSTRPVQILSNSAKRSANGDRPTLAKRPRLALGLTAIRPATLTPPNSPPNGSQTHDKSKAQRKPKTRSKVTTRQFKSHMNKENVWLRTASKRCNTLLEVFEQQRKLIESMSALDDNMCSKIAAISVDSMSLKTRQRLGKEIEVVENERNKLTATLSDHLRSLFREGGLLEQDLEQWVEKDMKISERIERSH